MYSVVYTSSLVACLVASVHSSTGDDVAAAGITTAALIVFLFNYAMAKHNLTPPQLVAAIFRRLIRG